MKIKLPQMLDVAPQIALTLVEAEPQGEKKWNYANSEKRGVNDGACSGKFGHPDQQSRISMWTERRSKSLSYRVAGRQPTQQVHRISMRSQQPDRSMRYNCSRLGHYAEHYYQATAERGNSVSQFNPSRWQITEVPPTNSDVPRRNNHLATPANAVRNYLTVPIQLDHSTRRDSGS
jgi:hypothetical protein